MNHAYRPASLTKREMFCADAPTGLSRRRSRVPLCPAQARSCWFADVVWRPGRCLRGLGLSARGAIGRRTIAAL